MQISYPFPKVGPKLEWHLIEHWLSGLREYLVGGML